jgi:hypothetical protein
MARLGRVKINYKPRDEYYTPSWIFEKLSLTFDLDPAHPSFQTNVPVKQYYTKEDDGLNREWFGRIWMNPPFSESKLWVHKFMAHKNGIALLPFAKSAWMVEIWAHCDGVVPLPYNIRFDYEGKTNGSIFLPTALFAYGNDNIEAIKRIGRVR